MLEQIRKMMAEVLQISSANVNKTREELLAEQATEDARYAATTSLLHPEGSSTPIEEAYSRAQDRVARIREQVEQALPKVMALLMALTIAEQRRDEAKLHREQKWESDWAKQATGIHAAARDWMRRLRRHGVHPHYLKQHSNETVAVISDLIIWKAKDATFQDPDNPWRQVLAIYARRKINKPGKMGRRGSSVPGVPQPDRHNTGSGDYRFDKMVSAAWGVVIHDAEAVAPATVTPPPQAAADRTISADGGACGEAENAIDSSEGDLHQEVASEEIAPHGTLAYDAAGSADAVSRDEYRLPAFVTDEAAARLQSAAVQLVNTDFEYWPDELNVAIGSAPRDMPDDDLFARPEAWKQPDGVTPFHHFLDAARRDGREAGLAAYREATIRRFMHMIATAPNFAEPRRRLGLE